MVNITTSTPLETMEMPYNETFPLAGTPNNAINVVKGETLFRNLEEPANFKQGMRIDLDGDDVKDRIYYIKNEEGDHEYIARKGERSTYWDPGQGGGHIWERQ